VLDGMSVSLVIEGIQSYFPALRGLPASVCGLFGGRPLRISRTLMI